MDEMAKIEHPFTLQMLKLKVGEICQGRLTPLNDGIPRDSWLYWFKERHPHLVMIKPQGLEVARAKGMNPATIVHGFYSNFKELYENFAYTPSHIRNVDENGCNASK